MFAVYTLDIQNAFSDGIRRRLTSADISPERALNYYQERLATLEQAPWLLSERLRWSNTPSTGSGEEENF